MAAPSGALTKVANEQEIRALLARIDAAWNAADAVAFGANWTEDGTNVNPFGVLFEGRASIQADIADSLAGPLKGSQHRLEVGAVYWPQPGTAVVDGDAEISNMTGPDGEAWPPLRAKFTGVCVKHGREWSVAHLRAYVFLSENG
ncbi:SgcJ/EcaC family oxidoreductase [Micromonospora sp. NPDC023966]|uniref:YybH family protein n=1 Tax=Micromonospora sp. NPDC023966 TaxID=3154699 RepID=UPI00340DA282